MGQKVNPNGQRIGINRSHDSVWFVGNKDFKTNLAKDIKIREIVEKKLSKASVSSVVIERNNTKTEVIIKTSKPGVVIGKGGENTEALKKLLVKAVGENIMISVMEVKNPDLDATLVAKMIAEKIENRVSYKSAQKFAIKATMRAGAKGIKTQVSGRLNGADMARNEGYIEGTIPLHTLRADIDYASTYANSVATFGKIGVKVWIYKGEVLPEKKKREVSNHVNAKKS